MQHRPAHRPLILSLLLLGIAPLAGRAQDAPKPPPKPPLKITDVRIGFNAYEPRRTYSKPGMWAPVQVKILIGDDKIDDGRLSVETTDDEGTPTVSTIPILPFLEPGEARAIRSYVLPGNMSSDLKVRIRGNDKTYEKDLQNSDRSRVKPSEQIYLTLGAKLPDFHRALFRLRDADAAAAKFDKNGDPIMKGIDDNGLIVPGGGAVPPPPPAGKQKGVKEGEDDENLEFRDSSPRFAAFETDPKALPDKVWGYQAVDLIILSTESSPFLSSLMDQNDLSRLRALGQWVRRGGHMVVSVHWKNQAEVARLMGHPVWQPPLPVQLSGTYDPARDPVQLRLEEWVRNVPFTNNPAGKIPIAQLRQPGAKQADWEVQASAVDKDGEVMPVIARMPYGLGSITFLAFSVDAGSPFSKWKGRTDFWMALIKNRTSHSPQDDGFEFNQKGWQGNHGSMPDLITKLHKDLDVFDVKIVPFGWVALFILIYIIIVGPVDYLVLKYVFKRLEWTWITFPIVVFAVSFAAYFTAYAIKGKELRVNQLDIVDIDMRTELDDKQRPAKAYIYGQTFFTLLSPRLQNYTIGLEPNPLFWGQQDVKAPLSAEMVSWMSKGGNSWGGPENRGAQMMFKRPYQIDDPADQSPGLIGVPISVWASKAFTATWDATLPQLPIQVDLVYHHQQKDISTEVTGKLGNNLPVDLEDLWLIYNDRVYSIADALAKGATLDVALPLPQLSKKKKLEHWYSQADVCDAARATAEKATYNPTINIKQAFVFEKTPSAGHELDQWLRRLDQSWRMKEEVPGERDTKVRDAILYARVRFRSGSARDMCADEKQPLPTRVWLGKLPGTQPAAGEKAVQPEPSGNLNQDTYIRFLVPVRPAR
jgi:hypothetical protein